MPRSSPIADDGRARQLVEMTIDSLSEVGFVGTTLIQIAGRAGVSPLPQRGKAQPLVIRRRIGQSPQSLRHPIGPQ